MQAEGAAISEGTPLLFVISNALLTAESTADACPPCPIITPLLVRAAALVTQVGHVTVLVLRDSGDENVELIPVNVKLVQAHWLTFDVGEPNNII